MKQGLNFKRFFASLMLLAVSTLSWAYDFVVGGIYYNITGGNNVEVARSRGYSGNIEIPSSVEYNAKNYTVTSIGEEAFEGCSGLTSVTIPNSVTSIGNYAFRGCSGLTSINIPNSVTSIGERTFSSCSGLTSVAIGDGLTSIDSSAFEYCSGLTSVTINSNAILSKSYPSDNNIQNIFGSQVKEYIIGDEVTSIGSSAFSGCSALTSVTIGDGVTSIGSSAFSGCSALTSVTIGDGVTSIGSSAFSGCSALTSVTIGDSVTSIGSYAFNGCSGLTSVTIPESVTSIGQNAFSGCSGLKSVTIGDGVTSIGTYAFSGCFGLTSVTIPNSVTSIGSYAFNGCSGLTSVAIGDGVTSIGRYAFDSCSGLTSVTIGNGVTSIGESAFSGCSRLTSVTLNSNTLVSKAYNAYLSTIFGSQVKNYIVGNNVTSIGDGAFWGCSGLTSVTIGDGVTSIGYSAFHDCSGLTKAEFASIESLCKILFNGATSNPLSCAKHLYIGGQEVKDVVIPNSVTSIGQYAFDGCSGLTSVNIPNSVTSIGYGAFSGCNGLTSVIIPESVTSIGEHAFYYCSGLTSITIGNSVTSIGGSAFSGCSSLTSVTINSNAILSSENYSLYCSMEGIFGDQVEEYVIGDNVLSIGNYAFNNCSGLTSITIPNSVTSIGDYAFWNCSGLKSATIPNSVTSIGQQAFYYCSGLTSITIGNSVTSIGGSAFYGCSGLTSVIIPNSVTSIGDYAFNNCTSLPVIDNLRYADTYLIEVADKTSNAYAIKIKEGTRFVNSNAFAGFPYLFSITIPNSVTSIGGSAFSGCSRLTSVTIGSGVTSIGDKTFENCSNLKSITIPNSVTGIGVSAFENCSNLKSITIPNSVTSIGEGAFFGCDGLTSVTINSNAILSSENYSLYHSIGGIFGNQVEEYVIGDNVLSIGDYAFRHCSGLMSITIPTSVTSIGDQAFSYCSGLESITLPNTLTSTGNESFVGCTGLTAVHITDLKAYCRISFGWYAPLFYAHKLYLNDEEVTGELVIPDGITSVSNVAFEGCTGITSVVIPEGVTSIGRAAFKSTSITSVSLPESLTSVGIEAFQDCSSLKSVTCLAKEVPSMGAEVFTNVPQSTATLYVPAASVNAYRSAAQWKEFGAITGYDTPVSSIALNKTKTTLKVRTQEKLTAIVLPEYATDKTVTWTSSDPTVATVDESGLVSAVAVGAVIITATTTDGTNLEASCEVTITWQPIYIETDFTSQFPTDYLGWNGATGYTPTQFAPMVTTNDGRTVQVCEKFNGSVAAEGTVFNRTLTGLTNGTYRIELYGAAASTKGRDTDLDTYMTAADEGNTTAVYLYATTPTGTVKQYIPVHWATSFSKVATAVLNNVVVTDGTVEIGMYSQKKFTNWEVIQIKGVTAMVDAEEQHASTLQRALSALDDEAYVNVTGEERTALSQAIADNTTVTEQTASAYQAAIAALENAIKTFTQAKESYDIWANVAKRSYPYASAEKKSAAESAASVLPTSARDALSKAESLKPLFRRYAESSAMLEGVEGAEDVTTTYIRNPKAEKAIDANVWQMILGQGSDGYINIYTDQPWTDASGSTNHRYFDGGQYYKSAWDVTLKQDVTLPAGRYQLTAVGRSSQDVTLTLIGGEATADMAHIGAAGGLFNNGWEQTSLEFELTEETMVSIGARGVTNVINNWMSFSDFRLVQFPETQVLDTSIALNKTEATLEIGSQEQLTATVLPEEAVQTVTWTSSDPTVATVDGNGLVTAIAAGTATITATTTDGTDLTASCKVTVEDPAIPGDVNGDGNVNGADIVAVINYVLADDIAGDVNGDGNVNGADIVAVINYVLNDSGNNARQTVAQSRAAAAEEPAEILSGTKTEEGISLSLTGGEDCTAFQFMLSLPEGASLTAVTGSEERLGDHELLFRRQQDGRYLVLGYAMDNHCIGESSGELLSLRLEGNANGRATVSEALIFTPQAETRYMNALEIDLPTAVSGVRAKGAAKEGDIYDFNGRRLQEKPKSGYYIQGGKKYFVK